MALPPSPEAPRWVQDGNIVYEGVGNLGEVPASLRESLAEESEILDVHLAHNHDALVALGITQKVLDIERAGRVADAVSQDWSEEALELVESQGVEVAEIDPMTALQEDMEDILAVDDDTQFRVAEDAENIYDRKPRHPILPGGILYVVIYNGGSDVDLDIRTHKVGSRIEEGEDVIYSAEMPEIPPLLRLDTKEVEAVDHLVERIKNDTRLPHLERTGRFDTLVVDVAEAS